MQWIGNAERLIFLNFGLLFVLNSPSSVSTSLTCLERNDSFGMLGECLFVCLFVIVVVVVVLILLFFTLRQYI